MLFSDPHRIVITRVYCISNSRPLLNTQSILDIAILFSDSSSIAIMGVYYSLALIIKVSIKYQYTNIPCIYFDNLVMNWILKQYLSKQYYISLHQFSWFWVHILFLLPRALILRNASLNIDIFSPGCWRLKNGLTRTTLEQYSSHSVERLSWPTWIFRMRGRKSTWRRREQLGKEIMIIIKIIISHIRLFCLWIW